MSRTIRIHSTEIAATAADITDKLAYERRQHALGALRNKYRNVTARIDRLNHGDKLANSDEEFVEMIGRHLDAITSRAGWTNTHRWVTQATHYHAAHGLSGLLQLITAIAWAL